MLLDEPIKSFGIERYVRFIADTDRLLLSAAESVASFYLDGSINDEFIGFKRDTLEGDDSHSLSTGGVGVTADLWQISSHVPYLQAALGADPFATLCKQRDSATEWLLDQNNQLSLTQTFGRLNPLTVSNISYQLAQHLPLNERAITFSSVAMGYYHGGWPRLPNVENAHPYVAARVFRAAEHLCNRGLLDRIHTVDPDSAVQQANISDPEDLHKAMVELRNLSPSCDDARRQFQVQANQYLWQQHGLASSTTIPSPGSLNYDPVGACFALGILVETAFADASRGDAARRLAEFSDLIQVSVHHILRGLTATGSLAYGLPFSYNPKGMGAFATSMSGLAAFVRTLYLIFNRSRNEFYGNAAWLEDFLRNNAQLLDQLFSLSTSIEGARRRVMSQGREFTGWSTDRAPSFSRIESWVTVDVLSFAIYLRLLAQEVAQFQVIKRFGGSEIIAEPEWPYDAASEPNGQEPVGLQDPDELLNAGDLEAQTSYRLAPIQVLHNEFREFMPRDALSWTSRKSSFLLFGPPGTAKTTLAKSLAKRLRWHFVELTPSNFIDQGLEMVERRAKEIFEELGVLRETVILFDELDSLLTDRELLDASSILNFSVPAMLPKLQKLRKIAARQRLLLVFATNFYDRLDPAMVRRGRVDERLVVLPHNDAARLRFFNRHLNENDARLATEKTRLAVFEDLQRYVHDIQRGLIPNIVPGITPTLYFSRIPSKQRSTSSVRATERLGIEVCEVVGRLLSQARHLGADSTRADIIARLDRLSSDLAPTSVPEKEAWTTLCREVSVALRATST